jgi:hypothetical protein
MGRLHVGRSSSSRFLKGTVQVSVGAQVCSDAGYKAVISGVHGVFLTGSDVSAIARDFCLCKHGTRSRVSNT